VGLLRARGVEVSPVVPDVEVGLCGAIRSGLRGRVEQRGPGGWQGEVLPGVQVIASCVRGSAGAAAEVTSIPRRPEVVAVSSQRGWWLAGSVTDREGDRELRIARGEVVSPWSLVLEEVVPS
jgi:hypothetical protein